MAQTAVGVMTPFASGRFVGCHAASRRGASSRAPNGKELELDWCESGAPVGVRFVVGSGDVDVVPAVGVPPGGIDSCREENAGRFAEKMSREIVVVVIKPDSWSR